MTRPAPSRRTISAVRSQTETQFARCAFCSLSALSEGLRLSSVVDTIQQRTVSSSRELSQSPEVHDHRPQRTPSIYGALRCSFQCVWICLTVLAGFSCRSGLGAEELGIVLGAATALRLACGPIAGRVADRFQIFRAELAACAILAASAGVLYLATQGFWTVMVVSLFQAATLAPLVPLADALSLDHAKRT